MENTLHTHNSQLNPLMGEATYYAESQMRTFGALRPKFIATTPSGPFFMSPSSLDDDKARRAFASLIQLMCVAHAATAGVLVLRVWTLMTHLGRYCTSGSVRRSLPLSER